MPVIRRTKEPGRQCPVPGGKTRISPQEARRRRIRREEDLPYAVFIGACLLLALLLSYGLMREREEGNWRLLSAPDAAAGAGGAWEERPEEKLKTLETEAERFPVYLSGAVNHPGIYEAKAGEIVSQLLERAGGFKEEPHSEKINLAETVCPHEQIYFPFLKETGQPAEAAADGAADSRLDLRNCSKEELMQIPGIGPATAEAILRFRESGKLKSVDDLLKVPGIKEKRFGQIRSFFK